MTNTPLRCPAPSTAPEVIGAFREAMLADGIAPPDHIEADGQLHRFSTGDKPSDKAGYYCLHLDGTPAGHYGCWRAGIASNWSARNGKRLDRDEQARLRESIKQVETERQRHQEQRARIASEIWDAAQPAQDSHPYLMRKDVRVVGEIRQADIDRASFFDDQTKQGVMRDCLLVKVEGPDGLQSLQAITSEGGFKPFMSGGRVAGGCTLLPGDDSKVYVVEGLATGLTVRHATGATVAVAFNSGNLTAIARRMSDSYPQTALVIAGDNDHQTDGNPGKVAAEKAAEATGAAVALPDFGPDESGTDWNDIHVARGLEAVREALETQHRETRDDTVFADAANDALAIDLDSARACHLLRLEPKPQRYVVEGMIPEPVAAAIVAPGSTGKSFWLMQLAACVATGTPFFGHAIPTPGGVLMLGAEDDQEELARRLHAIAKAYGWAEWRAEHGLLGQNFYPVSRLGLDNRLTEKAEGNITHRAQWIQAIIDAALEIENLRLIILDPVSRFRSGDENENEAATKFVEALETIRRATGVTVICAHHSRKGSTGDTADDIRGASAFVDALRFAATLAVPSPDQAKKMALDDDERRKMVRFNVVKSNYRTEVDTFWMRRAAGGVLAWTEAPEIVQSADQRAEQRYQDALPLIIEKVRQGASRESHFRRYAGKEGIFRMGDQNLRGCVARAIREGSIRQDGEGNLSIPS